ncbi:hypothetical protein JW921_09345 [Candidatus Fermentibacterales bacterium]|nr:hypothetical protein [Candidatus Fermentibacterales bacterium]
MIRSVPATWGRLALAATLSLLILACEDATYPFQQVSGPFDFYYVLPDSGLVSVTAVNSYLVQVRWLIENETQDQGDHSVYWDLLDDDQQVIENGLYFIRVYLDGDKILTSLFEVSR